MPKFGLNPPFPTTFHHGSTWMDSDPQKGKREPSLQAGGVDLPDFVLLGRQTDPGPLPRTAGRGPGGASRRSQGRAPGRRPLRDLEPPDLLDEPDLPPPDLLEEAPDLDDDDPPLFVLR